MGSRTTIREALEVKKGDMIVFVGAGGKTSAMNRLAQELVSTGETVFLTTTTKIYPPNSLKFDLRLVGDDESPFISNSDFSAEEKLVVIGKEINHENKIIGLDIPQINWLKDQCQDAVILVEGDGAKGKPFKAPRTYEPVIPEKAQMVIPVVGVDAIGKPLDGMYFHAMEQISALTELKPGDCLQGKNIAQVLLHPNGYQKGIPEKARWVPLINKVETQEDKKKALELIELLKAAGVSNVIVGSLGTNQNLVEIF